MRVDDEGRRGSGPLYAMGLNSSMTGVFYNKEQAAQIGMTEAPATLAEFDSYLQAAKDAGLIPIAQFNGGATGGLAFPLQNLMTSYGDRPRRSTTGSSRRTAPRSTPRPTCRPLEHLEKWIDAGYFAEDINSMDYSMMMSRFIGGQSIFIFDGDWESGNLDTQMAGNVGFFLMPLGDRGWSAGGDVRTADLRHLGQRGEPGLRGVLPRLVGHQRGGAHDRRRDRWLATRWDRRTRSCRRSTRTR